MLTKFENIFFVANIRLNVVILYPRNIFLMRPDAVM